MANKQVSLRGLIAQYQTNCERIREIAENCEKEARARTEAEEAEYTQLRQTNDLIRMKIDAEAAANLQPVNVEHLNPLSVIRENLSRGHGVQFHLVRDINTTDVIEPGGIIPVKIQDVLDPLSEGLILDKVGLPFLTGLAGDYIWPTYEAVEATILGEAVELGDTKVELSKLTATPQRVGIAVPVTRESLDQSEGTFETVVRKLIPVAMARTINKIMFSPTQVTDSAIKGPFVGKTAISFSATPTFAEYNDMKAQVLATGVPGDTLCWVMTQSQKAIAEATPKDAGSGIMVCENDHICGLPVFCTHYIGEGNIGLGDWQYQPAGLFGDTYFVVDPYSKSRQNAVDFVFNVNFGTATLRPDAFALATVSGTATAKVSTASTKSK